MKHKNLLLTLLAAATVTACNNKKSQPSETPQPATEINLMTYNVHNCIGLDDQRDYHRIAEVIRQASPDVVALQELDSVTGRNEGVDALDSLRALTGCMPSSPPLSLTMEAAMASAFFPKRNRWPSAHSPCPAARKRGR